MSEGDLHTFPRRETFPILNAGAGDPAWVAWALIASHEEQAVKNHYRSLERLASRGGLALDELAAVLEDRPWRNISHDEALSIVKRHAFEGR